MTYSVVFHVLRFSKYESSQTIDLVCNRPLRQRFRYLLYLRLLGMSYSIDYAPRHLLKVQSRKYVTANK